MYMRFVTHVSPVASTRQNLIDAKHHLSVAIYQLASKLHVFEVESAGSTVSVDLELNDESGAIWVNATPYDVADVGVLVSPQVSLELVGDPSDVRFAAAIGRIEKELRDFENWLHGYAASGELEPLVPEDFAISTEIDASYAVNLIDN